MPQTKTDRITVNCIRMGKAAVLCVAPNANKGKGRECWIPYSLIENPQDIDVSKPECELDIHTWFVTKEGLN
jgi:hypothetical protein